MASPEVSRDSAQAESGTGIFSTLLGHLCPLIFPPKKPLYRVTSKEKNRNKGTVCDHFMVTTSR